MNSKTVRIFSVAVCLLVLSSFIASCNRKDSQIKLDVKKLVNKTEFEVAKIMGDPDTAFVWTFLGKRYRINMFSQDSTEIRYYNGKTCAIILHNPKDIPFDASSIEKFGLPKAKPTMVDTSATILWKNIDGIKAVNFYKVGRKVKKRSGPVFEIYFNLD